MLTREYLATAIFAAVAATADPANDQEQVQRLVSQFTQADGAEERLGIVQNANTNFPGVSKQVVDSVAQQFEDQIAILSAP